MAAGSHELAYWKQQPAGDISGVQAERWQRRLGKCNRLLSQRRINHLCERMQYSRSSLDLTTARQEQGIRRDNLEGHRSTTTGCVCAQRRALQLSYSIINQACAGHVAIKHAEFPICADIASWSTQPLFLPYPHLSMVNTCC